MINYDNETEEMTMTCDNCRESILLYGGFVACISEAKYRNWIVYGFNWNHYCSKECKDENFKKRKD